MDIRWTLNIDGTSRPLALERDHYSGELDVRDSEGNLLASAKPEFGKSNEFLLPFTVSGEALILQVRKNSGSHTYALLHKDRVLVSDQLHGDEFSVHAAYSPSPIWLMNLLMVMLIAVQGAAMGNRLLAWAGLLALMAIILYITGNYAWVRLGRLHISPAGIAWRSPLRNRELGWEELSEFSVDRRGCIRLADSYQALKLTPEMFVQLPELVDIIGQRSGLEPTPRPLSGERLLLRWSPVMLLIAAFGFVFVWQYIVPWALAAGVVIGGGGAWWSLRNRDYVCYCPILWVGAGWNGNTVNKS
ncbi:MAG: hypothetical protein FH749_11290 [Firmicutes bacterium]|nr:hypothetical protein [Bacillota bacterium]